MGEGCACLRWGLFSSNQKLFLFVRSVILRSPRSSTQVILPFSKSFHSTHFQQLERLPTPQSQHHSYLSKEQMLSWENTYIFSLKNRLVFLDAICYICRGTICATIKSHVQQLCPGCLYTFLTSFSCIFSFPLSRTPLACKHTCKIHHDEMYLPSNVSIRCFLLKQYACETASLSLSLFPWWDPF